MTKTEIFKYLLNKETGYSYTIKENPNHYINEINLCISYEDLIKLSRIFPYKFLAKNSKNQWIPVSDYNNVFIDHSNSEKILSLVLKNKIKESQVFDIELPVLDDYIESVFAFNTTYSLLEKLSSFENLGAFSNCCSLESQLDNKNNFYSEVYIKSIDLWINQVWFDNYSQREKDNLVSKDEKEIYIFIKNFKNIKENYYNKITKIENESIKSFNDNLSEVNKLRKCLNYDELIDDFEV